jgi:hypothetical protein
MNYARREKRNAQRFARITPLYASAVTPPADWLTRHAHEADEREGLSTLAGAANWKKNTTLGCAACLELTWHNCGMTASSDPSRLCPVRQRRYECCRHLA